jgi:RNA polymerase sigma-70 factor (ECF subfamily)
LKQRIDVTKHIDDLWRFARVLTRSDIDADDLLQDALVRALSRAHSYDRSRPLLPWLLAIVRNTYLTRESSASFERRNSTELALAADWTSPPDQEDATHLLEVQAAMERLPDEQAEVLYLIGVLGMKYAEAAEILGIPIGTVMSRLSRARIMLRENLNHKHRAFKVVGGRDA